MTLAFGGSLTWNSQPADHPVPLEEDELFLLILESVSLQPLDGAEGHDLVLGVEVENRLERNGEFRSDRTSHLLGPHQYYSGDQGQPVEEYLLYSGPVGKALTLRLDLTLREGGETESDLPSSLRDGMENLDKLVAVAPKETSLYELGQQLRYLALHLGERHRLAQVLTYTTTLLPAGTSGARRLLQAGRYTLEKRAPGQEAALVSIVVRVEPQDRRLSKPECEEEDQRSQPRREAPAAWDAHERPQHSPSQERPRRPRREEYREEGLREALDYYKDEGENDCWEGDRAPRRERPDRHERYEERRERPRRERERECGPRDCERDSERRCERGDRRDRERRHERREERRR